MLSVRSEVRYPPKKKSSYVQRKVFKNGPLIIKGSADNRNGSKIRPVITSNSTFTGPSYSAQI
jgi:hypothetical protein